ncbi:MAG TPA: FG-GAP-like repeat-containing protein [Candidatus Polarisedimenticolaceae bacterium]|nr:FG-GAP-like repeat-containing protein [Candidatus Polarisedimenticolaceae bacterium]
MGISLGRRRLVLTLFALYLAFVHLMLGLALWKSDFVGLLLKNLTPILEPLLDRGVDYSTIEPLVIPLAELDGWDDTGGVVAADLDGDGRREFVVTGRAGVAAFGSDGARLWFHAVDLQLTWKSEVHGLPGRHAPGVAVADVDGDSSTELMLLTRDGRLVVIDGVAGAVERTVRLPVPADAERWEHLVLAHFRRSDELDLLLQATDRPYFRSGRFLAAYDLERLLAGEPTTPLWATDRFRGAGHSGVRVADLDGDGLDEVVGAMILGPDGGVRVEIPVRVDAKSHVDALHVADVRPDLPGLEVVALEESPENRIFLYNHRGVIWVAHHRNKEAQFAAIGDFDTTRPGLEVWSRSRMIKHQTPWIFDSRGRLIASYWMNFVTPPDWTVEGMAVPTVIDWTGSAEQLVAAMEFGTAGDVAVFDPVTGRLLHRFEERAERLYVADVQGDWREELIVASGGELHVYSNDQPNPRPEREPLWNEPQYVRRKINWNSYNP